MTASSAASASRAPGLIVCLALGAAAVGLSALVRPWVPALSPLLLAILAGMAWRNLAPVPERLSPGIAFAAKPVLRTGIVLLGLQLALGDVLALGWGVIGLVVAAVGVTFAATLALGRALRLPWDLTALVASGFSICGAAAVAASDAVVRARREMAATAIGLVVLFGTLMIPLMPLLSGAFGLSEEAAGLWIGASTHEVAQVVAAGGLVGSAALSVAVTVKLARVVMLAPVMAVLAAAQRRRDARSPALPDDGSVASASRPPLTPWFVVGFVAAMLLRSTGLLPAGVLDAAAVVQQLLLATAMAALGLGVHLRSIAQVGPRPLVLGAASTAVAVAVGGAGAWLLGPGLSLG